MKDKKTVLLMEIAKAYFLEHRTQSEIARSAGVTPSQISRYLKEARRRGMVQVRVVDPEGSFDELEGSLRKLFPHLADVVIAPSLASDAESTRDIVGRYAANYLHDVVRPGQRLVIGCGRTLRALANALLPRRVSDVSIVQAVGNLGHEAHGIDYNEITRAVAHPFGARPYFLSSPAILGVGSGTAAELIRANATIRQVLDMARHGDIYVVGLGSLQSDRLYVRTGMISQREMDEMKHGVVGDICGRFFDAQGRERQTPFASRIIGIELTDLRRGRLSVGIACGKDKVDPIVAAVRGRFINALVSDEDTVRSVLQRAVRRHQSSRHERGELKPEKSA